MAKQKKLTIVRTQKTTRRFEYQNEIANLGFTLCVDNSQEPRAFKTLLEQALSDVNELIEGMKN